MQTMRRDLVCSMDHAEVRVGSHRLPGEWQCPDGARGIVVFAHGSGSSRLSPRNRFVAEVLHQHRLATLLFDLLSDAESADRRLVFDLDLLARRLGEALDWLRQRDDAPRTCHTLGQRRVGLFGASTGAAAALQAAAECPGRVAAVVARGGRVDLVAAHAPQVQAPTLLIVGGADLELLALNRSVLRLLRCEKRLEVVPGAGHLFAEPGTLDAVAHLAGDWFVRHGSEGRVL